MNAETEEHLIQAFKFPYSNTWLYIFYTIYLGDLENVQSNCIELYIISKA